MLSQTSSQRSSLQELESTRAACHIPLSVVRWIYEKLMSLNSWFRLEYLTRVARSKDQKLVKITLIIKLKKGCGVCFQSCTLLFCKMLGFCKRSPNRFEYYYNYQRSTLLIVIFEPFYFWRCVRRFGSRYILCRLPLWSLWLELGVLCLR